MSASTWRALDRPAIGWGSNGEQIARAALQQIMVNLDAQCELQETLWISRDRDWATLTETSFAQTRINRVPKGSFYLGAQPSLVAGENARFDKWPAVTARCGLRTPSEDRDQPDHYDNVDLQLVVEVLAFAGPFRQDPLDDRSISDEVDRQYQRLSDAVVSCINQDRTLGQNALPLKTFPRMTPSLPYVRREKAGAGRFLIYQAMELLWIVSALSQAPGL